MKINECFKCGVTAIFCAAVLALMILILSSTPQEIAEFFCGGVDCKVISAQ